MSLLKRAEGIVNLVILTLKSEDQIKKEKEEKKEVPKEPEKPVDPATIEVTPGKKIVMEIKTDKKPLGVIVVGGKNNYVKVIWISYLFRDQILYKESNIPCKNCLLPK